MRRPALKLWPVVGLVAAVVIAVTLFHTAKSKPPHRLTFMLSDATNIVQGQEVKAGTAKPVGDVDRIQLARGGHAAKISLRIDDSAWPLTKGTKIDVRLGGTASFFNRFLLLTPGPAGAPALPDGAQLPAGDVTTPVEFDDLLRVFNGDTRRDLKSFVNRTGPALADAKPGLQKALPVAPAALTQGNYVIRDLIANRDALDGLIRTTGSVVDSVQRAQPGFGELIQGAATTIKTLADKQTQVKTLLSALPGAFDQINVTTAHVDRTLAKAEKVTTKLDPGITQLRAIAHPLNTTLRTLQAVGPDAQQTLRTVNRSAPAVTQFAYRLAGEAPQLGSIADKATQTIGCVRPYSPEIMGLFSTWGDFLSTDDGKDKILRAQIENFLPANNNSTPYSPEQAKQAFPQLRYGFPRPPGYNAGQPWYQPQCGAGPDAVNPADDHEARGTVPNDEQIPEGSNP